MKKPPWLVKRIPNGESFDEMEKTLSSRHLKSVCQEARCPNIWECFSRKTATFLILGSQCTRNCGFCAIATGTPLPPDPDEPARVSETALSMGLTHVVVTSVSRDDLVDGGSVQFAETIVNLRSTIPGVKVEVLIPDFMGNTESLETVLDANPDVLNHNLETAGRLYFRVRPQASYSRSLDIFKQTAARANGPVVKSGLMLGIGETDQDILTTLKDLRAAGCTHLTLGQYLQPAPRLLPVDRFISPGMFRQWRIEALSMGFRRVSAGPFVRSSYHADEMIP